VIDAARPAGRELREKIRAAHEEMRALMADPSAGEEAVLAKADTIGALHTELRKHELRTLLQVRARLSAEQQAQLTEAMGKKHCRGGSRHERRHVL
jgi:Spy/CpxP family protein refolding chaperone